MDNTGWKWILGPVMSVVLSVAVYYNIRWLMYPRGFVYLVGYVVIDMMSTYTDIWLCSLIYVWDRLYVDISI